MGVGEAGAVKGDKPQAHADKGPSAGSVKEFNEALGRSAGSASSTQAAAGTAARASGGKPAIVRIDANYRSKSATATLSDGSKVPLALTKNNWRRAIRCTHWNTARSQDQRTRRLLS